MKKTAFCLASAILLASAPSGQWEQHILKDQVNSAYSVYAADLDGDGDSDALTAELYGSRIAWFENIGGPVVFGPEQVINASVPGGASEVFAADLDGDSDLDVVAGEGSLISWYGNDGFAEFPTKHAISTGASGIGVASLDAADLDGDGDLDVLSGMFIGFPAWYENLDGLGLTWAEHPLAEETLVGDPISAVDLDGDGDPDVLMGTGWYENLDGFGSFGPLITTAFGVAADFDGDGDMDALSPVGWHENIDGLGTFGPPQLPGGIFAVDVEGDGDEDILTAGSWFENTDGLGVFGPAQTTSGTGMVDALFATDFDQDGDADILATEGNVFGGGGNLFVWYENPELSAFAVTPVLAFSSTPVSILGEGFDATTEVQLDGVPEPVISFTSTQLTIQPNPADPGFRDVTVLHPGDPAVTIKKALRLLPVISGTSAGPGASLYVEMQNGDKGVYVPLLSSGSLASPVPLASPPTWYGVLLDPASVNILLEINAFTSAASVTVAYPIPSNPALSGLTVYLQAWCQQGLLGPGLTYSFTNLASVTF